MSSGKTLMTPTRRSAGPSTARPTLVYLPEHTVDLDTGAIVQAQVLPGDHRDSEDLSERVIEAAVSVQEAMGTPDPEAMPQTLTADKGCFSLEEDRTPAGTAS